MNALERFLKYAAYSTASAEGVQSSPTTERQFALARELARELAGLGAPDAVCTDKCCVYANFPATPGLEGARAVGFIAHMGTSPDFCGEGVTPTVIPGYDGGDVELGCGRVLRVSEQPHLASLRGRTLVTTSGDTLLGADDKAGVAEIMTMAERLASMPHGPVSVCFTPDEEVGRGTAGFDFELFKAGCAYTVDGGQEGEISWENFNASSAVVSFKGVNVHPGDATNVMVNAGLAAVEFASRLPEAETPRLTSGRQGFYHLTGIEGEVGSARLSYILRDHDEAVLRGREEKIRSVAGELNAKYGAGTVSVEITQGYRNMAQKLLPEHQYMIDAALEAIRAAGVEPVCKSNRGGTDGAVLSWRGLPCPNLGTGGYAFHGPYEHITAEGMDICAGILCGLVKIYAGM